MANDKNPAEELLEILEEWYPKGSILVPDWDSQTVHEAHRRKILGDAGTEFADPEWGWTTQERAAALILQIREILDLDDELSEVYREKISSWRSFIYNFPNSWLERKTDFSPNMKNDLKILSSTIKRDRSTRENYFQKPLESLLSLGEQIREDENIPEFLKEHILRLLAHIADCLIKQGWEALQAENLIPQLRVAMELAETKSKKTGYWSKAQEIVMSFLKPFMTSAGTTLGEKSGHTAIEAIQSALN